MWLAQGPQSSDAREARTNSPFVSSQALYHWATALPLYPLFRIVSTEEGNKNSPDKTEKL